MMLAQGGRLCAVPIKAFLLPGKALLLRRTIIHRSSLFPRREESTHAVHGCNRAVSSCDRSIGGL